MTNDEELCKCMVEHNEDMNTECKLLDNDSDSPTNVAVDVSEPMECVFQIIAMSFLWPYIS